MCILTKKQNFMIFFLQHPFEKELKDIFAFPDYEVWGNPKVDPSSFIS